VSRFGRYVDTGVWHRSSSGYVGLRGNSKISRAFEVVAVSWKRIWMISGTTVAFELRIEFGVRVRVSVKSVRVHVRVSRVRVGVRVIIFFFNVRVRVRVSGDPLSLG